MLALSGIHPKHTSCPGLERYSAMATSKSSWGNGKANHNASNGQSNSLMRIIVGIPIALALFALVLQIRESGLGPSTIADEGLIKCVNDTNGLWLF